MFANRTLLNNLYIDVLADYVNISFDLYIVYSLIDIEHNT